MLRLMDGRLLLLGLDGSLSYRVIDRFTEFDQRCALLLQRSSNKTLDNQKVSRLTRRCLLPSFRRPQQPASVEVRQGAAEFRQRWSRRRRRRCRRRTDGAGSDRFHGRRRRRRRCSRRRLRRRRGLRRRRDRPSIRRRWRRRHRRLRPGRPPPSAAFGLGFGLGLPAAAQR